ncbi:MAG: inorganic phosphate transporter [Candidatus Bathyarchaeia archaeon]
MAPVTGSGLRNIGIITLAGGVSSFIGAFFIGKEVESTIGKGIIVGNITSMEILIILLSISVWITFTSYKGWPTSTTHSTVGAAIGLGLVKFGVEGIQWRTLAYIISAWTISPIVGLCASYLLTVYINHILKKYIKGLQGIVKASKLSAYTLFALACITAFMSGGNDVGNATAFINPKMRLDTLYLRGLMGLCMAFGLIMLGRRVLLTVGVELVELTPISALASLLSNSLVLITANVYGLPLSSSQILVSSVIGTGLANNRYVNLRKLIKIFWTWIATFIATASLSVTLYHGLQYLS